MRRLGWILVTPVVLAAVALAVANRASVSLRLNPFSAAAPDYVLQMPLYAVILAAMLMGILIGGGVVWIKQRQWRRMAKAEKLRNAELLRQAGNITVAAAEHNRAA